MTGAVLPILHLNGYKISNPTIFGRMTHEEMESFFRGCSWKPYFVEGDDPMTMHEKMAETLDTVIEEIHDIQKRARAGEDMGHIPVAYDRSAHPEGLDWPEGSGRQAHRGHLPCTPGAHRHHCRHPEPGRAPEADRRMLHSYHAEELFDENGTLIPELQELAPTGDAVWLQAARKRRQAAA